MDEDYATQTDVYVTLNGTSTVVTSGVNAMRAPRGEIILAGSSGVNEGAITANQATTHANVFFSILANYGQTTVAAVTVPANRRLLLKRLRATITRANGAAGSATIALQVRPVGQAWRSKRVFDIGTGAPTEFDSIGGDIYPPRADIKFRVLSVSDNNTVPEAAIEYILFNID